MMLNYSCDVPLELPLPRRAEAAPHGGRFATGSRKTSEVTHGAGYVSSEGVASPLMSQYDPLNRGMPCKLFVGGVSAHTTTEALRGHFSKYGRIIDAVVMQKNGRPRGFGFVTFDNPMPAECVLAEAQWLDGRLVDVKRAVPGERAQERASNKIFVGGLSQDVSTDELRAYFSLYGAVADAVVMVDRRTNRSRGFGFVRFGNGSHGNVSSEAVLMDFASHRLAGKWVEVKRATPASQLQEMFPGQDFDEEMYGGMTAEDVMAMASMGMNITDFMGMPGWDSPCGDLTPMSLAAMDAGSAGSNRSHARGRRARRRRQREQKPGCFDDGEDSSDEGTSPTASFGMPIIPLDEVAFVSTLNGVSGCVTPSTAASTPLSSAQSLGPLHTDRSVLGSGAGAQRQKVNSYASKGARGFASASENDPGRANAALMPTDQPMKVGFVNQDAQVRREDGGFTRDDFLSLEVGRPGLNIWI